MSLNPTFADCDTFEYSLVVGPITTSQENLTLSIDSFSVDFSSLVLPAVGLPELEKVFDPHIFDTLALALVASGRRPPGDLSIPWWVIAMSAVVLSLGTYAGGWRIMRTLGRRIVDVDPPHGFAAETTAAAVLYAATATGAPISTTHVITSAIMGVGATRSRKAVRWGVARSIVNGWLLTFPAAGLAAAAAYALLSLLT